MQLYRLMRCCLIVGLMGQGAAWACTLKVGWEEWHPYISTLEGGLSGSEYVLLQSLATRAECQLQFIEVPWVRALVLLENGQLDLLYGASRSAERERYAVFSMPYRYERMELVVRGEGNGESLSLLDWLTTPNAEGAQRMIGLIRGFHYGDILEPIVRANTGNFAVHEVRFDSQLRDMLLAGRIDGYLIEAVVGQWQREAVGGQLRLHALREHQPEPMHLMFSKQVPTTVVNRINAAISELRTAP